MSPVANAVLGVGFLIVAIAATFTMYRQWGYPYDHEAGKSEAPAWLVRLHRCLGYVYLSIYLYFMVQMVPRLWNYQIEFPARTVMHLTLGMLIGAILIVKLSIVRFFRHLESALLPLLGTALLLCTMLVIGLSAPFAFVAAYRQGLAGSVALFAPDNLKRVRTHLTLAGLEDAGARARLATPEGLRAGQAVLSTQCVQCHDLRTVLVRPRTPKVWRQTVRRMAERSTLLSPINEIQQWQVTAYLIAISPELQQTARLKRAQTSLDKESLRAADRLVKKIGGAGSVLPPYNRQSAHQLFASQCSQCHRLDELDKVTLRSEQDVRQLVTRMVENGMETNGKDLAQIVRYLVRTRVKPATSDRKAD